MRPPYAWNLMARHMLLRLARCAIPLVCAAAVAVNAAEMAPTVYAPLVPKAAKADRAWFVGDVQDPPTLRLEALDATELTARRRAAKPHQRGFARALPDVAERRLGADHPNWQTLADGRQVLVVAIEAPGAGALRLGAQVRRLPEAAVLRFGTDTSGARPPVAIDGREILKLIGRNRAAAPDDPEAVLYWSPRVRGERLLLELELPAGANRTSVDVDLITVSQFFKDAAAADGRLVPYDVGDAGSCQNDIRCDSAERVQFGSATALISYVDGGESFACSGVLLNDSNPGSDFHFVTANHCIPNQVVASTIEFHWYFRSEACNSIFEDLAYTPQSGGATLLNTLSGTYDTSLLRLNQPPPGGVTLAGWTTAEPQVGQPLFAIHHPEADWQKVSFANADIPVSCELFTESVFCSPDQQGNFFEVNWTDGVIEAGSSGSGIYSSANLLFGTLSSSSVTCANPNERTNYASFGDAYSAGNYAAWLSNPVPPPADDNRARNLSTRGQVEPLVPMHGGIVVEDTVKVLIAARGPTTGLDSALADTTMALYRLNAGQPPVKLQENDNWQDAANADEIATLTASRPLNALEAAFLVELSNGSYTATASDAGDDDSGETVLGFTLVEDAATTGVARNLSTRGLVRPGIPMHGGIVVGGSVKVLITARGPTTGLQTALDDTTLELFLLRPGEPPLKLQENDDWQSNANADEIATLTANRPLNELEAALLITLPAGSYTAMGSDFNDDQAGEMVVGFTVID
ncbi:MAG: trypsin-like serine protease [Gammaproteobacteria bacterium]|nr:trypsin-like serine protease [Gammaproteobacteria bacterium]